MLITYEKSVPNINKYLKPLYYAICWELVCAVELSQTERRIVMSIHSPTVQYVQVKHYLRIVYVEAWINTFTPCCLCVLLVWVGRARERERVARGGGGGLRRYCICFAWILNSVERYKTCWEVEKRYFSSELLCS